QLPRRRRDHRRADRPVGLRQDDDRPHGARRPPAGPGAGAGLWARPTRLRRRAAPAHRLHAPALRALPGALGRGEPRLHGLLLRRLDLPPRADGEADARPRRARARAQAPRRRRVGRRAAPARARLHARPRPRPGRDGRADGWRGPRAAQEVLGPLPRAARPGQDAAGNHAVRDGGRILRPGGRAPRRSAGRVRRARRGPARGDGRRRAAVAGGRPHPPPPRRRGAAAGRGGGRPGRTRRDPHHSRRRGTGDAADPRRARARRPQRAEPERVPPELRRGVRPAHGAAGCGAGRTTRRGGAEGGGVKELIRIWAFAVKELRTIFRQKRLLGTLVLGPFLILLLFGVGFKGGQVPIRTIVVVPGATATQEVERYRQAFGTGTFQIVDVTRDEPAARARLDRRQVDAVVVLPGDAFDTIYGGHQAQIAVLVNEIDPVRRSWIDYNTFVAGSGINRSIVTEALREGKSPTQQLGATADRLDARAQQLRADVEGGDAAAARGTIAQMRSDTALARALTGGALSSLETAGQSLGARAAADVVGRVNGELDR